MSRSLYSSHANVLLRLRVLFIIGSGNCTCYGVRAARRTSPLAFCYYFAFGLLRQFCVHTIPTFRFFHNLAMLPTSQSLQLCVLERLRKMSEDSVRGRSQVGFFCVVITRGAKQCCHFWCFNIRYFERNFLMFCQQIWCWLGCCLCFPHFLSF